MKEETKLRYIVFLICPESASYMGDRTIDKHDGAIFCNIDEAREYAMDAIREKLCTRFVIGQFIIENSMPVMGIYKIETFGFRNDKKALHQMSFFE